MSCIIEKKKCHCRVNLNPKGNLTQIKFQLFITYMTIPVITTLPLAKEVCSFRIDTKLQSQATKEDVSFMKKLPFDQRSEKRSNPLQPLQICQWLYKSNWDHVKEDQSKHQYRYDGFPNAKRNKWYRQILPVYIPGFGGPIC